MELPFAAVPSGPQKMYGQLPIAQVVFQIFVEALNLRAHIDPDLIEADTIEALDKRIQRVVRGQYGDVGVDVIRDVFMAVLQAFMDVDLLRQTEERSDPLMRTEGNALEMLALFGFWSVVRSELRDRQVPRDADIHGRLRQLTIEFSVRVVGIMAFIGQPVPSGIGNINDLVTDTLKQIYADADRRKPVPKSVLADTMVVDPKTGRTLDHGTLYRWFGGKQLISDDNIELLAAAFRKHLGESEAYEAAIKARLRRAVAVKALLTTVEAMTSSEIVTDLVDGFFRIVRAGLASFVEIDLQDDGQAQAVMSMSILPMDWPVSTGLLHDLKQGEHDGWRSAIDELLCASRSQAVADYHIRYQGVLGRLRGHARNKAADLAYRGAVRAMRSLRLGQALALCRLGTVLNPLDARLHAQSGAVHLLLGRSKQATNAFQVAVALAPRWDEAHMSLMISLAMFGRSHEAWKHLRDTIIATRAATRA